MRLRALAAVGLVTTSVIALAPTSSARTYTPGDNPMCVKLSNASGAWRACLSASGTDIRAGQPVTFTSKRTSFDPGTRICLARSGAPYGAYTGIAACTTVNKNGSATIVANLGRRGAYWYDFGDAACLAQAPADRSPTTCGDNGGTQSTPVKVRVR